ncbi:MAG: Gfo/Idh/MocA family oxidoreductase [Gloeobacteraceae cyanobacterium ES-bin-144]|nr:Gfo/Idh/MocA family oxidoreductase [Verrucomicrobiales bacterium]
MNHQKTLQFGRRSFMSRCSAAAVATGLPLWFVARQLASAEERLANVASPNSRPRIGLIGSGSMGMANAKDIMRLADIVAVCDVDQEHVAKAVNVLSKDGKSPEQFADFRKLLESDQIDAIINGTPDHWHSFINIAAARAKKDIYSEKPLTLTIAEGAQVVKAVRDNKVVLQTGTWQRSSERFRLACELIRNGRIGKLKEVNVWLPAGLRGGPFTSKPVPAVLNWDFWQGQAPLADYVPERCHRTFRNWYDYSGGTMTDWGAHHMDIGYWAVGLPAPIQVESKALATPTPGGYTTISEYEVKFTYSNGVIFNVRTTPDDSPYGAVINPEGQRNGIRFEGADGWIWVNRDVIKASDRELLSKKLPEDAERLYFSNDHRGNFIDCMSSRKDPICAVEIGHRSASVCHIGTISLRTGKKLQWDPDAERFTGEHADEANTYLSREMRKPYDYSFVS